MISKKPGSSPLFKCERETIHKRLNYIERWIDLADRCITNECSTWFSNDNLLRCMLHFLNCSLLATPVASVVQSWGQHGLLGGETKKSSGGQTETWGAEPRSYLWPSTVAGSSLHGSHTSHWGWSVSTGSGTRSSKCGNVGGQCRDCHSCWCWCKIRWDPGSGRSGQHPGHERYSGYGCADEEIGGKHVLPFTKPFCTFAWFFSTCIAWLLSLGETHWPKK